MYDPYFEYFMQEHLRWYKDAANTGIHSRPFDPCKSYVGKAPEFNKQKEVLP